MRAGVLDIFGAFERLIVIDSIHNNLPDNICYLAQTVSGRINCGIIEGLRHVISATSYITNPVMDARGLSEFENQLVRINHCTSALRESLRMMSSVICIPGFVVSS